MLVLSRKRDESVIFDFSQIPADKLLEMLAEGKTKIEITVVDIRGDKVRLGIECPKLIPVHRREVHEAIQRHRLESVNTTTEEPKDAA